MSLLERLRDEVGELAKVEQFPRMEGRQMVMVMAPAKPPLSAERGRPGCRCATVSSRGDLGASWRGCWRRAGSSGGRRGPGPDRGRGRGAGRLRAGRLARPVIAPPRSYGCATSWRLKNRARRPRRREPPVAERLRGCAPSSARRASMAWSCRSPTSIAASTCPRGAAPRLADRLHRLGRLLIVLPERAALFVDGRYTVQAAAELDPELFERRHVIEQPPAKWLGEQLGAGQRSATTRACTPRPRSSAIARLRQGAGAELVALDDNPVDAVWTSRPPPPIAPIWLLDERLRRRGERGQAGAHRPQALAEAGAEVPGDQRDGFDRLAAEPARGGDVPYNPLLLSFAPAPCRRRARAVPRPAQARPARPRQRRLDPADRGLRGRARPARRRRRRCWSIRR